MLRLEGARGAVLSRRQVDKIQEGRVAGFQSAFGKENIVGGGGGGRGVDSELHALLLCAVERFAIL